MSTLSRRVTRVDDASSKKFPEVERRFCGPLPRDFWRSWKAGIELAFDVRSTANQIIVAPIVGLWRMGISDPRNEVIPRTFAEARRDYARKQRALDLMFKKARRTAR